MNYVLQIVRGRSEANTLRLIDGVNSIGRHDDCQIRIRSSQVSRRHCELFEDGNRLMLRDLGSSNGTFVNGKRVLGQQTLKPGDVLTIGGVTLRVDLLGASQPEVGGSLACPTAASDTAELTALPVAEDDLKWNWRRMEEFEVALDNEPDHIDIIPLDDEPPPSQPSKAAKPATTVHDQTRDKAKGPAGTRRCRRTSGQTSSPLTRRMLLLSSSWT